MLCQIPLRSRHTAAAFSTLQAYSHGAHHARPDLRPILRMTGLSSVRGDGGVTGEVSALNAQAPPSRRHRRDRPCQHPAP
jgi:hypothetical protein